MDSECCCTIELTVLDDAPLSLQVLDEKAPTWSSSEYIPMESTDLPEYEGAYSATPSWQEQTLATANRVMRNDLSIEAIVKLEVINESGGLTLTI